MEDIRRKWKRVEDSLKRMTRELEDLRRRKGEWKKKRKDMERRIGELEKKWEKGITRRKKERD